MIRNINNKTWALPGTALTVVAGLVLILFSSGCTESETGVLVPEAVADPLVAPPTLSDLAESVSLTGEQAAKVEAALGQWRDAHDARAGERRRGFAASDAGLDDRLPPRMEFLAESGAILDQGQFLAMVEYLGRRHQGRRNGGSEGPGFGDGNGPGRGSGGRGGLGRGQGRGFDRDGQGPGELLRGLDLTDAERRELRNTFGEHRAQLCEARQRHAQSETDAAAFAAEVVGLHQAFQKELGELLGEETAASLRERRTEHKADKAARKLETMDRWIERRLSFVTRALNLTDEQVAEAQAAAENLRPKLEAFLTSVRDGGLSETDAITQGILLKEEGREALRAILNPDQIERLDAVRENLPRGGKRGCRQS